LHFVSVDLTQSCPEEYTEESEHTDRELPVCFLQQAGIIWHEFHAISVTTCMRKGLGMLFAASKQAVYEHNTDLSAKICSAHHGRPF
jgi:hypothetical protein